MSKTQGLRVLVKQFLSETADQIVEAVEKMILGCEEEMFLSKRRRNLLDVLLQPDIRLNETSEEAQLNISVWEEDLTEQQQEWTCCEDAVKHILSVAAGRIAEAVEKTISGYKREMHKSKRESSWQCKMLNALLQPEIRLTRIQGEIGKPLPIILAEQMPIETDEEVLSPGFSVPENDDDWNDGDSDGNEATQDAQRKKNKKACVCKVCGKYFLYEGPFLKHLKSHPKDDCGLCGMQFKTDEDFELHLKTHKIESVTRKKAKVAVCDVCGQSFRSSSNLETHMRIHSGEKPFTCQVCGKSFKYPAYKTDHLRTHSGERPFVCEVCGKSFITQGKLTRHHLIHTGEKPYTCNICGENFVRYATLRKHRRIHLKYTEFALTGTTPVYDEGDVDAVVITKKQLVQIICKVCGKDFHSKVSLVKHLESHPKDICGLCGMHFNTEEEFELHLKTHEDEMAKVCDICGKCFANPFNLDVHMRGHTGEKRFKCNVCDKPFRQQGQLADHIRIHTGEKPFSCTTCGKCFRTSANLRQHRQRCRIETVVIT